MSRSDSPFLPDELRVQAGVAGVTHDRGPLLLRAGERLEPRGRHLRPIALRSARESPEADSRPVRGRVSTHGSCLERRDPRPGVLDAGSDAERSEAERARDPGHASERCGSPRSRGRGGRRGVFVRGCRGSIARSRAATFAAFSFLASRETSRRSVRRSPSIVCPRSWRPGCPRSRPGPVRGLRRRGPRPSTCVRPAVMARSD